MVRLLLLIILLSTSTLAQAQEENDKVFFSEALAVHLPKYEINAKRAYRFRNYEEAQRLFDSLVQYGLKGSYMDNFKFNRLNGKKVYLYDLQKPIYLITYASWCVTSKGEIPALNRLAKEYSKEIDFVVLYWDDKASTRKAANDYNQHVKVLYVNELNNKDAFVVSHLKHTLGLPTIFLIDKNKKILDVRRGVNHPYGKSMEASFDMNYNKMFDGIANHLLGNKAFGDKKEPVAAK